MTQQRDSKVKKGEKANQHPERKAYSKPQLIEYGHLEKMTQHGTGGGRDFRDRYGVRG
jgi:hypothetical protein